MAKENKMKEKNIGLISSESSTKEKSFYIYHANEDRIVKGKIVLPQYGIKVDHGEKITIPEGVANALRQPKRVLVNDFDENTGQKIQRWASVVRFRLVPA